MNSLRNSYAFRLEAKAAELAAALRDRQLLAVEPMAEEMEKIVMAAERELAVVAKDRDSRLLREVRAALARLDDGRFGICGACEEEITAKRLAAIPWARYCLRCQENADSDQDVNPATAGFREVFSWAA